MPPLGNLAAPSSFERLINHNLYCTTSLYKGADEQLEEHSAKGEAGPACSVEHLMEQREVFIVLQTHLLEGCRHGASLSCQERAYHQDEGLVPGMAGEH